MSTTTNTKQLNDLFARIPHCKADGTNYVLYRNRFVFAADAATLGHHLELTTTSPAGTKPVPADPKAVTTAEQEALDKWDVKNRAWRSEQAIVKQGIASTISDALFLKVKGEATAALMWAKVKAEFEKRSQMMVVDLAKLQAIREDLIAMGADPGDDNFVAILLGSLPTSYDPYLAALTAASSLLATPLSVDTYVRGISDEADRRAIKARPKEAKEAVFNANGGNASGQRRRSKNVECYNCHKKGHIKAECWAKGGGKEGKGPRGKGKGKGKSDDSANKVTDHEDGV